MLASVVALSGTVAAVCVQDTQVSRPVTLFELVAESHLLETVLQYDDSRNNALLFSKIDPATVSEPLQTEVRKIASQAIANFRRYTEKPFLASIGQHHEAIRRLRELDFVIDAQIVSADAHAIIDCFAEYPFLDPRILAMSYRDHDTISIVTGVVNGPLDGGGSFYVARRESGRWVVRRSGSWVS